MLKGRKVISFELLQHIVDSELMLNSITTSAYLSSEKVNPSFKYIGQKIIGVLLKLMSFDNEPFY